MRYFRKLLIIVFAFAATIHFSYASDDTDFENLRRVNPDFYVGKALTLNSEEIWLGAERLTNENIEEWREYAERQYNASIRCGGGVSLKALKSSRFVSAVDGASHFYKVLEEWNDKVCETWVTSVFRSEPQQILKSSSDFDNSIMMYVSVTSSPDSLITTHMGIAFTYESIDLGRPRRISMHLHSFGAKIMLNENPKRLLMVNAPVARMERIMMKAMPEGSVHIGDKSMQRVLKKRIDITYPDYCKSEFSSESKEVLTRAERKAKYANAELQDYLLEENDPNEIAEIYKELSSEYPSLIPVDGKFIVDENKVKTEVEKNLLMGYRDFIQPFQSKELFCQEQNPDFDGRKALLDHMETSPPLIEGHKIYDPKNPDEVLIDRNAPENYDTYAWMQMRAFKDNGLTHYIAADLNCLANLEKLVPID